MKTAFGLFGGKQRTVSRFLPSILNFCICCFKNSFPSFCSSYQNKVIRIWRIYKNLKAAQIKYSLLRTCTLVLLYYCWKQRHTPTGSYWSDMGSNPSRSSKKGSFRAHSNKKHYTAIYFTPLLFIKGFSGVHSNCV